MENSTITNFSSNRTSTANFPSRISQIILKNEKNDESNRSIYPYSKQFEIFTNFESEISSNEKLSKENVLNNDKFCSNYVDFFHIIFRLTLEFYDKEKQNMFIDNKLNIYDLLFQALFENSNEQNLMELLFKVFFYIDYN